MAALRSAIAIAAFGDINIDVVLAVDRLPHLGGEVFSTSRSELLGGSAVNTAVVLARLGHRVELMGAVGDDEPGRRALGLLDGAGVGTKLTGSIPGRPTAMNTILVTPDGERTMIGARGANVSYVTPPGWHAGLGWLHVSGYALLEGQQRESAIDAFETAQARGIPTSLDVPTDVGERIRAVVNEKLAGFTIVSGNRESLGEITTSDNPAEELLGAGVERVVVSSGAEPLLIAGPGTITMVKPPRVDSRDATGAGDAMVAGLIAATLAGIDIETAAVLAAATGAAATLVPGAAATLADPEVWPYLLDPGRWRDVSPERLEAVRRYVAESR